MGMLDDLFCGKRCLARIGGAVAAFVMILGGLLTMITLSALCLVVGIYMFFCGVFVGVIEAPIFFTCWEWSKQLGARMDQITPLHKGILYICMSIFLFFCIGAATILAAILLLGTAFLNMTVYLESKRAAQHQPLENVSDDGEAMIVPQVDTSSQPAQPPPKPAASTTAAAPAASAPATTAPAASGGYPWEKYMDSVGEAVGRAAGAAVAATVAQQFKENANQQLGLAKPAAQPAAPAAAAQPKMTGAIPASYVDPEFNPFAINPKK
eukprot:m.65173 g.65173  ORF g.65173 m.65173 type:complete len:267 (-) comp49770_c0_seq1:129-929(-)